MKPNLWPCFFRNASPKSFRILIAVDISTSLNVVSWAYVSCDPFKRPAIILRRGDIFSLVSRGESFFTSVDFCFATFSDFLSIITGLFCSRFVAFALVSTLFCSSFRTSLVSSLGLSPSLIVINSKPGEISWPSSTASTSTIPLTSA